MSLNVRYGSNVKVIFCEFLPIVYLTFGLTTPRVYILQPNEDHHENHKEILNKRSGGDKKKKFENFYA